MAHSRELLQALEQRKPRPWRGIVYRHMFADYPPERENTLGARWNPPDVPAIYTSLARETVLAEAEYQINMEPRRPLVRRTVYRIQVSLQSVLDLSAADALAGLGLNRAELVAIDHTACQRIGGAVEWLEHDGLLVPSARAADGVNLAIYPNRQGPGYEFRTLGSEVIYNLQTRRQ